MYFRKILDIFGYAPKLNNEVLKLLENIASDVVVTTAPWNEGIHYWKGKRIVIVHDFFNWPSGESKSNYFLGERDRGRKTLEMLAFADFVICESQYTAKIINEAGRIYNLNDIKLSIVPLPPAFEPKPTPTPPLAKLKGLDYWFVPSHIAPLKNQEVVIDALIELKKDDCHPNVVFSFPSFSYIYLIKILIKILRKGLWSQIYFFYKATEIEMHSLYTNCQGVILSTKIGPTNMPAVEAAEFDKCCVATHESVCGYGDEYKITRFGNSDFKSLANIIFNPVGSCPNISPIKTLKPSVKFRNNIIKIIK
jgi:glycosyltransferase involved in cell wall biosynthesis